MSNYVRIWDEDGLSVSASWQSDGSFRFEGLDMRGLPGTDSSYEYYLTVKKRDVPEFLRALRVASRDEVLPLVAQRGAEIVRQGEQSWLRSLGIEPDFWSWVS